MKKGYRAHKLARHFRKPDTGLGRQGCKYNIPMAALMPPPFLRQPVGRHEAGEAKHRGKRSCRLLLNGTAVQPAQCSLPLLVSWRLHTQYSQHIRMTGEISMRGRSGDVKREFAADTISGLSLLTVTYLA